MGDHFLLQIHGRSLKRSYPAVQAFSVGARSISSRSSRFAAMLDEDRVRLTLGHVSPIPNPLPSKNPRWRPIKMHSNALTKYACTAGLKEVETSLRLYIVRLLRVETQMTVSNKSFHKSCR